MSFQVFFSFSLFSFIWFDQQNSENIAFREFLFTRSSSLANDFFLLRICCLHAFIGPQPCTDCCVRMLVKQKD